MTDFEKSQHTGTGAPWVLVADDDPATRLLLRKKLEKSGYHVVCAKTGKEAVEQLSDNIASAVLDLKMPEGDGLYCLRYIRQHYPDMAPLMLTASENIANAVEAMKQGALDYVTKPFNPGQVAALVDKSVETCRQTRRLKTAEKKLEQARQHQLFVATQIQHSLLLGRPPEDLSGMQIARMTIPSQQIDGDFYDFIQLSPDSLDVVVADIMGKGIMAAFMAAALKSAFLRVINETRSLPEQNGQPNPEQIVAGVHRHMIEQMNELETFVTFCYGRFDFVRHRFVFVDCGHVRTIHWQRAESRIHLLSGVNMPLGFPETAPFQQMTVSFAPGDMFVFYSDGVTEAADPDGNLYGEDRLAALVEKNAEMDGNAMIAAIYNDVVDFTGTEVFSDDFTCVCAKIQPRNRSDRVLSSRSLSIDSDLENLKKVRFFIRGFCREYGAGSLDELRISQLEVAATELVANIIKHGLDQVAGHKIHIIATVYTDRIEMEFRDPGKPFDPTSIAPPVLDGSRENGMGCYLISQFVDHISYHRDEAAGINSARIQILLFAKD
ncbi:sigma-B regulation protein RsbU (phosphoserine phosphatase) [Desulfosalsimonas propionicica]|uniref:Sigma-B regulation protein RsbU (Phosphoserine phosphatase) n=1 Tax=Desulfosalsimonas propionicica TaxID=332175 RepID=A0A7W0C654_9BACT|nr:SpoIIE family protein phosphatase [Desulfosalsimonas propionicica]MBA2879894.1 sigma-B regulation protein RsbU (phosphoserine phosphatase) [Desulfosalsimonas propionicica]